ncbi:MAG: DUF805 domain-containing protein, partial [Pseudomonadota bacterium]
FQRPIAQEQDQKQKRQEARRCHDRDSSALFLLILFVPIVGTFYGIYLFIVNGFFPGTPGPNQFDTMQSKAQIFD